MEDEPTPPRSPTGSGIRPARFGFKAIAITVVITAAVIAAITYAIVGGNNPPEPEPSPPISPTVAQNPDPAPPEPPTPPIEIPPPTEPDPPKTDPNHPLTGRKKILLATPGNARHTYLSFTSNLAPEAHYPLATLEKDDPCIWELVPETDYKNVYHLYSQTPDSEGHWAGAELSYTVLAGNDFPHATLEKSDPLTWEILPVDDYPGRYHIRCFRTDFDGQNLTFEPAHDFLQSAPYPLAVVKNEPAATWLILPEDAPAPKPAKRVSHVVIFPREDIGSDDQTELTGWIEDIRSHVGKNPASLALYLDHADGTTSTANYAATPTFAEAAAQLAEQEDPVAAFLPGALSSSALGKLAAPVASDLENDPRTLPPFPIVIPLVGEGKAIDATGIETLKFEDDDAYVYDKLESLTDFQSHLEDRPTHPESQGRVFHGAKFTYIFVRFK